MVAREGKFPSGSKTCGKVIMKAAEASDKGKEHKRKMRMERKATVRWSRIFGRNQTDEAVRAARTKETNFANTVLVEKKWATNNRLVSPAGSHRPLPARYHSQKKIRSTGGGCKPPSKR